MPGPLNIGVAGEPCEGIAATGRASAANTGPVGQPTPTSDLLDTARARLSIT